MARHILPADQDQPYRWRGGQPDQDRIPPGVARTWVVTRLNA
jgi:hypothetical protein